MGDARSVVFWSWAQSDFLDVWQLNAVLWGFDTRNASSRNKISAAIAERLEQKLTV